NGSSFAGGINAMATPSLVSSSDLAGLYLFGSNVEDSSGLANHGLIFGDVAAATDLQGSSNGAYAFDGDEDYIEIDNPVSGNFTISFWINTSVTTDNSATHWYNGYSLIDGKVGDEQNDFGLGLDNSKILFGTGGSDTTITGSSSIADGTWHHVSATRSTAGALILYIDGKQETTGTGGTNTLSSPSFLSIGKAPFDTNAFTGSLDRVRLYGRVLTATEI
ncbi:MAG: LamG domain-containing protein, partial [Planctomycetes bacterium]|nr:LamG domain-containing protein [Planctomycetota bacterium]